MSGFLTWVLDINEYLPRDTVNWCHTQLLGMGFGPEHPPAITPTERFTPFHTIYLQFRDVVSAHLADNSDPVLALSEAPRLANWNNMDSHFYSC